MTVITTHINADFDAFAAMLAAKKLYPEALVVFPGSQERNLRDFFVKSMVYMYNIVKVKDIDLNAIKRLVLVDTRQAGRIGRFADIVNRPGLEIHIYDHHPAMPDDIAGTLKVIEMTGAAVTIMTKLLREKSIPITPDEATIMALGLYEDTGSFTFSSTTADDYHAAAYLLSRGANLNVVANMITREMSPEQISLLNEMIQNTTHHTVNGVDVAVTRVSCEDYVADFALLVHKLRDMENLDVIFALATMENRVYMVARSRVAEVDVGEIAMDFGGGGHPSAAAATIKGQTLIQVEHRLFGLLHQRINAWRTAADIMSSPVIQVKPQVTLKEANSLLTRYNVNTLLVSESGRPVGMISRQVIEKGLHHKLHNVAVREYMTTEIGTVTTEASISEIQEKIITNKQRLLPVTEDAQIVGVITRTDLLNTLVDDAVRIPEEVDQGRAGPSPVRKKNVKNLLQERLPDEVLALLKTVGEVADSLKYHAYAVGGFVRDILLFRENFDIDIVVEGEGIAFARALADTLGGRVRAHEKFGTAVVILPDGQKIDVATARLEYYRSPAALPVVEMGSIKFDLYRRDFTINTLAIQLNPDRFGMLIDFFGGQLDLKRKVIRVLHNLSFVEDPTRVFRAVRFEQRFGFRIAKLTAGLIENAVKMDFFKEVSGRRLFAELRHLLEEEKPINALRRLNQFKLLKVIHPKITYSAGLENLLHAVDKVLTWHNLLFLEDSCRKWLVYLLALERPFNARVAGECCERLALNERDTRAIVDLKVKADQCLKWMEFQKTFRNSDLYRKLHPFPTEHLLYMMASTTRGEVRKAISRYFTKLRSTTPLLGGDDLKKMGLEPGPVYREILDAVLNAQLNRRISTREEAKAFVRRSWGT
ncbi:MAG: CBS domain-containing protein [Deltaproteobacteria bacterium]|nr:CBS domain-containing protein [Deltaproteobacteria bacterium]